MFNENLTIGATSFKGSCMQVPLINLTLSYNNRQLVGFSLKKCRIFYLETKGFFQFIQNSNEI